MPRFRVEIREEQRWTFLAMVTRDTRDEAVEYVRGVLPRRCERKSVRAQLAPAKDQERAVTHGRS